MAELPENKMKERIINHMNDDHHASIIRYLEHYHKLSPWQAYDGKMCSIDLNGMTIVRGKQNYRIPFDPPMKSYSEARTRVVEMDKQCISALGKSDISITDFLPATGLSALPFGIILATFLGYSQRWWFAPGSVVERLLGVGFAKFSWTIQPYLITGLIGIHTAETLYFIKYKLLKHSVSPRESLFWKWVATTFVEGMFAFQRFDALVAKKREAKEKQKH